MVKKRFPTLVRIFLAATLLTGIAIALPRIITAIYSFPRLFLSTEAPVKRAAIVFGAGVGRDGKPSPVLRDRVATAAQLYFSGKVEKLLMSGDNRRLDYNEPAAMSAYAISLGVPEEAIVLDFAGRRTYDTCYRARQIFGLEDVILVTQAFHQPRALYTCNRLGVKAVGVPADLGSYQAEWIWRIRELPATMQALLDVHITHPLPVLGDPEPIFSGQYREKGTSEGE